MTDDQPGPAAGPLPPREPARLPGERLLRRRASMSAAETTSVHPEKAGLRHPYPDGLTLSWFSWAPSARA